MTSWNRSGHAQEPSTWNIKPLGGSVPSPPAARLDMPAAADTRGAAPDTLKIPLAGGLPPDAIQMNMEGGLVTIVARDAPLNEVLALLARQDGLNIVMAEDSKARVSITLNKVPLQHAIGNILAATGYTAFRQNDILLITSVAAGQQKGSAQAQGRVVQVFRLDFTSAADVNLVVKGLLSPAGQSFPTQTKDSDNRKTQETLVVEDLPWSIERIAQTIKQLDVAPRQVMIEAHVLSVNLANNLQHGVNLEYLANGNASLTLRTDGLANSTGFATPNSTQAIFLNLASNNVNALISAIQNTTDSKTLASPKVFVLNGQEAHFQVGSQLGFKTVTTTQTSSMENVQFLNTGVILAVTPQITADNQVLMKVKPSVSTGQIDQTTGCPDSNTTEVETAVMLPDGHGIVIGGLIQEEDTQTQAKIPILGDLWLVGRLFQQRQLTRTRNEVIISLIPHIVPYPPQLQQRECGEFVRSATPIWHGALERCPRPEPRLPDGAQIPPWRKLHQYGNDGGAAANSQYEGPPPVVASPADAEAIASPRGTPQQSQ